MKRHFTLPALLAAIIAASALAGLLAPQTAAADCSALPSSLGTSSLTLNVASAGTYRVWVREAAPAADIAGFYLQIPDAGVCQITMGNASITPGPWTWVDYQNADTGSLVNVNLPAGNHTVTLAGLKSGVEVDRLLLLTDTACTPTGDGSNCIAAASATPTPSGAATPAPVAGDHGIPGNPNAPLPKSSNPLSNLVAAAGRYRNPLLFSGSLIIAIPLLWFVALHLGLIHPAQSKPSGLDLPGQPKSETRRGEPHSALPESHVTMPDKPSSSDKTKPPAPPEKPKPPKAKMPELPETPPAPKPGTTTAPSPSPPPGAPSSTTNKD